MNIGRGSNLDEKYFLSQLKEEKIGGGWLDVFENEPLSEKEEVWD